MTPFDMEADGALLDALALRMETKLTPEARGGLLKFAELVSVWGAKTDLVAARTPAALVEILCLDALVLAQAFDSGSVVDVGAGAGAPALPLALLQPSLSLTLVEPRRKRVAFMRTAVGSLGLSSRVRVIEGRSGDITDTFDGAFSRATFEPREWLERGRTLAPRVGVLLATESPADLPILWERRYCTDSGAPRHLVVHPGAP